MNNTRSRKNRSSSARGGRGKGERQIPAEGVYTNHRFMQSVGALVGLPVMIQTKTNDSIEGVFTTFSSNFDLVLDMANPVTRGDNSIINPETIKRKMIFSASDIVTIKVNNVDLDYATKEGFAVDQVISRFNGQVTERPLEPWTGDVTTEDSVALGEESSNGWDVDDMFRKNEEKYGVTTSYTPEMEGYTTPLNRRNTREYREREAKAQRIAAEIMSAPATQVRSEAENGDEETRFSAVVRPADQPGSGGGGGGGASKYVPPMLRKKNQNAGKLLRSTPPPTGPSGRYSGSNPTTPTSPSCSGPPQVSSGSHSPIGGPSVPGSSPPGYPQQQGPPPTHSPSPAGHPNLHRHNSHSHPSDSKVNGDAKGSYDRRHHDGPVNDQSRENHHNDSLSKPDHHSRQHHADGPQKNQQKPPPQHQHQANQHAGHIPPMGQSDHRKQEPREQREPRKQRATNKEDQLADLKKFSQDFKLSDQPEKKAQGQQQHHQPPPPQQQQQPPEPQQQPQPVPPQQHAQQVPPAQPRQPPPQQTQQPPPPQPQQQPPPQPQAPSLSQSQPPQQQQPPPQPQQAPPPQQQQPPPHMPQQPPQQRQTPPVSAPIPQGPPQNVPQSSLHPQNPPPMTMSPVLEVSKAHEEAEKVTSTVSNSKLNPNAKEFVFNPNAKPFSPRSPSTNTTTPPRPHTPQTPQIPSNQPPQMSGGGPAVGYQQAMVSAAYVIGSPPFAVQPQPPRFSKRVPMGSNQRPEYTSQMQVAAATGQPILAPAPMNTQPQTAITAVQIPQNMLPQTHNPYQQYPGMPMMLRFPHAGVQMVTAIYNQASDAQQQSQQHGHQTMYMTPTTLPPHQPHPSHTPGPQPTQPPTPQNPGGGGGGPPNMPNQPPTPGPTPPQPLIYSHMSGQPSLPQHLPQHSPHTAQSPHGHQYPGQNAAAAGVHHGGPGQQMAAQIVMIPPNIAAAGPHMMHPSGPPPHSATAHIPSSMAGFTPTSSAGVQHMASAPHIQYLPSTTPITHSHHVPLVRHSQ